MVDVDRLKKIRESIQSQGEEEEFEKRDVAQIIARLRVPKIEALEKPVPVYEKKTLNFATNVDFPRDAKGFLSFVGSFYQSFEKLVSKIASFLSSMPTAGNMRNSLDGAAISLSVETYLVMCAVVAIIAAVFSGLFIASLALAIGDPFFAVLSPLIALIIGVVAGIIALSYPEMRASARSATIDKSLPFALRQLSTQVKAGVGFHKALASISTSGYGVLSEEFAKVVSELNSGSSTDEALGRLALRTRSKGLRRAITQINRSFRTGGNLSAIISDIAEDVSFETRMSIRDFTEKLNFINIVYIMVAVVAPVVVAVLSAILQIPLFQGGIPPWFVYVAFGSISLLMVMIMYVTKRMEPTAW